MTLLAEVVEGEWRPGIGDPTPVGWLTVAAYFVAAVACGLAAWREPTPVGGRRAGPSPFWLVLAALMVGLGINKQLDFQTLLTVLARRALSARGLYEQRRAYQVVFIAAVAATCAGLLGVFLWMGRRSLGRRWPALVGMAFILGFVVIRAASFHHVDALLASRLGGLKWNWLLELGGILVVAASAFRAARSSPSPSPRPDDRGHLTYHHLRR